jgi:predicted nucleic acid-binding protein
LGVTEGVILDTGPLAAYLIENDEHHDWAVKTFDQLPPLFWTCEAVLTEAAFLAGSNSKAMRLIGKMLEKEWLRLPFQFAREHKRVLELMEQYHSVPMSFADSCLVRMAELLEDCPVLTVDGDFLLYRKHRRQGIQTIMPPNRQTLL